METNDLMARRYISKKQVVREGRLRELEGGFKLPQKSADEQERHEVGTESRKINKDCFRRVRRRKGRLMSVKLALEEKR